MDLDDLQFYYLLKSISVISGQCKVDNERLCVYYCEDFAASKGQTQDG